MAPRRTREFVWATCPACHKHYQHEVNRMDKPDGTNCGALLCRARTDWTDAEWAEHAKFARIRRDCRLSLSELSLEALSRTH